MVHTLPPSPPPPRCFVPARGPPCSFSSLSIALVFVFLVFSPVAQTSIALDHSKTADVNLSVLQRLDPGVTGIQSSCSHTAAYEHTGGAWKRKEIEGALFVVER